MNKPSPTMRTAAAGALFMLALFAVGGCATPGGLPGSPANPPPAGPETEKADDAAGVQSSTAQCVLGSWQIDKGSELWTLWTVGTDAQVSGTIYAHFTDGDFYGIEYDNVVIDSPIVDEIDYTVETVWNGISSGFYEVNDDGTVTTDVIPEATITTTQTTPLGAETSENVVGNPVPLFYTCDGDRLEGHVQEDPSTIVVEFDRID